MTLRGKKDNSLLQTELCSHKIHIEALTIYVAVFENRAFNEVNKVKQGQKDAVLI